MLFISRKQANETLFIGEKIKNISIIMLPIHYYNKCKICVIVKLSEKYSNCTSVIYRSLPVALYVEGSPKYVFNYSQLIIK